ncbi:hypothetical protein LSAT2_004097 [Lamellibrachia satsuma]|nr:hypothetical protein LSAT2_004097 [Lamellibrachia satsuma]
MLGIIYLHTAREVTKCVTELVEAARMSRTTYRHLVKGSVDLRHWRCIECLDASMAIEEPMEAEDDRQIAPHVHTPPPPPLRHTPPPSPLRHTPPPLRHTPPPLRHAPVASVTPTAPLANSSVGYFQLGFSFGGNNTATETTGLSHVILESTRLSDGPVDATTSLDASVDDSRDDVSDALQVENAKVSCKCTVKQVGETFTPGAHPHAHPPVPGAAVAARISKEIKEQATDNVFRWKEGQNMTITRRPLYTASKTDDSS